MAMALRTIAAFCCLPLAAAGAAQPFGVKPGLWEISHESRSTGLAPIPKGGPVNMPPEQRARQAAAQKGRPARSGDGNARSRRECITLEQLEDPFRPDDRPDAHCTHRIVSRSSAAADMHLECKDTRHSGATMNGTFHWQAVNSETMSGNLVMNVADGQHTMTTTVRLSGKWLGADCGRVKPHVRERE
jgi:uncharacterized protein DUF3617